MSIAEKSEKELIEWDIENVIPVMKNNKVVKYQTSMSAGLLATLANEGIITYNERTQRGLKRKKNGELEPFLMKSKIKQIYEKLISAELNGMLITLNALIQKDEKGNIINPIEYSEEDMHLFCSGEINAIDGWHRISSCRYWLKKWEKNKGAIPSPWDYNFVCVIERMDESTAGLLFSEYGFTQLKISSSKLKFLDINDYANIIVRNLMTKSHLKGKIEVDKTSTKGTNHIVTFSTLNDAIKKNYKINSDEDVENISEWMTKFFNKLISLYPDYMGQMSQDERNEKRNIDLTIELLSFYGYVGISSRLYGKEDWENQLLKLKDVVKVANFEGTILDKSFPLWKKIFKGDKKIVNSSTTRNYVNKIMGDYIEFGLDYILENNKELLETE